MVLYLGRLQPYWQILYWAENLARDKRSSLFCRAVSDEEKKVL